MLDVNPHAGQRAERSPLAPAPLKTAAPPCKVGRMLGRLHGVPLAHEDMYYPAGKVCTCGSKIRKAFKPAYTATVLARLEAAPVSSMRTEAEAPRSEGLPRAHRCPYRAIGTSGGTWGAWTPGAKNRPPWAANLHAVRSSATRPASFPSLASEMRRQRFPATGEDRHVPIHTLKRPIPQRARKTRSEQCNVTT